MKKIITLGFLFISSLIYSQGIQMIEDDEFTPKTINQSFVLFKIRIIDGQARHSSEEIESGRFDPAFRISKYDEVLSKSWDTRVNSRAYIEDKIKSGRWIKIDNSKYAYEWLYVLKTNPRKSGYYFESLTWYNTVPVMRKIAPENNKLYNYGTIEITIDQEGKNKSYKLLDDETEKEKIIKDMKASYPNVYNAYIDKISDDKLKFFYTVTTIGELKKKYYYVYWSKLYGDGIEGPCNYGITINSKKSGQSQQTHLSIGELIDLPLNYDISFTSEWKKGEPGFHFGLITGNSENNKYLFYTTTNEASGIIGTCNNSNSACEVSNKEAFTAGEIIKEKHHRVEIREKHATYYINDIWIADFDLNNVLSEDCFVGFLVDDKQKVFFDKFQICEQ
jgi:hypothetical protein